MKKLILLTTILFVVLLVKAQWIQTNGPFGGCISKIASNGTNIFAGNYSGCGSNDEVFVSSNNGVSWTPINNGLPAFTTISSLLCVGTNIFAGTFNSGLYISSNNGQLWTQANNGLPNNSLISSLILVGTNIFASVNNEVYVSTNNGNSWSLSNVGLSHQVICFASDGTNLFAGTYGGGVYFSTNNGNSWMQVNTGLSNNIINTLKVDGINIYAGTDWGVYFSNNNGNSWSFISNTIPNSQNILSIETLGTNIFASVESAGVFMSSDNGNNWTLISGITNGFINDIKAFGSTLFAGGGGIYRSVDNGNTWALSNNGTSINTTIDNLFEFGSSLFASSATQGIFQTLDNGNTWDTQNNGFQPNYAVTSFAKSGSNLLVSTGFYGSEVPQVLLSTDSGNTWTSVSNGLPQANPIISLASIGTTLFAASQGGIVFKSTDNGNNWIPTQNNGLVNSPIDAFKAVGSNLYLSGDYIYLSTDFGDNWTQIKDSSWVYKFAAEGNRIYIADNLTGFSGIYLTTDNGTNWTLLNNGLPTNPWTSDIIVKDSNVYAAVNDTIYVLYNNSNSWTPLDSMFSNYGIYSLGIHNNFLYAGTNLKGVWKHSILNNPQQCQASFTYQTDMFGTTTLNGYANVNDSNAYPITYSWSFNDGTNGSGQTITHTFAPVWGYACLIIQTANGCSSTFCDTIIANGQPSTCQANFYSYTDSMNVPPITTYNFIDQSIPDSTSTIISWNWTFTGGTPATSALQNPTGIVFQNPGIYTICLTTTTSSGCTSTYCNSVFIDSVNSCQMYANINAVSPTVIGGNDGYIESAVVGGTTPFTYLWNNGITTANVYGLTSGYYSLTVNDANGCQTIANTYLYEPYDTTGGNIVDTLYTGILDSCLNFIPDSFYIANITTDPNTNIVTVVWVFMGGGQTTTFTVTYTYSQYGNTLVVITLNCGSKTLTTYQSYINITNTSVVPIYGIENNLFIYPVPFSDKINIDFINKNSGNATISLIDGSGRILITKKINTISGVNKTELNTSLLSSGLYILTVTSNTGIIRKQIIK